VAGVTFKGEKNMNLMISTETKIESEKLILTLVIGILVEIENGSIDTEEAECRLFNPYSIKKMQQLEINPCIIELLIECCELDNVKRIVPDSFSTTIVRLRETALGIRSSKEVSKIEVKKWID
jgi:hypothetical protein